MADTGKHKKFRSSSALERSRITPAVSGTEREELRLFLSLVVLFQHYFKSSRKHHGCFHATAAGGGEV